MDLQNYGNWAFFIDSLIRNNPWLRTNGDKICLFSGDSKSLDKHVKPPQRNDNGCIRNHPLYPHSLFPAYIVHSYSSLEGVNENEWVNPNTKCTRRTAAFAVCLRFINHLRRAAPVVRLKDVSWTLSRKLCINPVNLQLICTCVV